MSQLFDLIIEDKEVKEVKEEVKEVKEVKENKENKEITDLKIQTGYGQKISLNVVNNIKPLLEQYTKEHKGGFIYGGNTKSGQDYFTSLGTSDFSDNKFDPNTIYWWASGGKILTGLVIAKMLEEGIIRPDTPLYTLNKTFSGKGTYYKSIKVIDKVTFPLNPASYEATIDTFDWEMVTVSDLIHLNIGLINDFIVCGAPGVLLFNPISGISDEIISNNSIQGLGAYIQSATYLLKMLSGNPIGISTRIYSGENVESVLKNYLEVLIHANTSGILPLIAKPGVYTNYNIPYGTRGLPTSYDTSYLFLGAIIDPALKKAGYINYADYARKKFFEPMSMNNSWLIVQEIVPLNKVDKLAGYSWRRSPVLGLTQVFDINNPQTWGGFGCSDEYRKLACFSIAGPLVWSNDPLFESDSISKYFKLAYNTTAYPELQTISNAPLISSIEDFSKLIKMVCNRGFYGTKQIIKTETWNYLIGTKVPSTASTISAFPYPFSREINSSYAWSLGFARINRDLNNETIYGFDETTCFWAGLTGCYYIFDYYTGNYLIYGMPESILSSGTLDIPFIGTPSYSEKITSNFLIAQIKD